MFHKEKLRLHGLVSKVMKIITVMVECYRRPLLNPRELFLTFELFRRSQRDFASNNNCVTAGVVVVTVVVVVLGGGDEENNKKTNELFLVHSAKNEKKNTNTYTTYLGSVLFGAERERKKKPGQRLEILSLVFDIMCLDTVFYCDGPINCRTNSCKTRY